jgi:hypothetical protein
MVARRAPGSLVDSEWRERTAGALAINLRSGNAIAFTGIHQNPASD